MSVTTAVQNELARLSTAGNFASGPERLAADVAQGRIECELVALDALACRFERLSLLTDKLASASVDDLKKLGAALSKRLNYLLEPIGTIEVDGESCTVQLRSNPPQKDDDGASYYELLVKRGEIRLVRYNKPRGEARRAVPATVTREVFLRLAADFCSAIC
jgi:hypothetical protein